MPKHGWNKLEQGWNRIGGIKTDHSDPLNHTINGQMLTLQGPKMVPNGSIWLLLDLKFRLNGLWCPNVAIYGVFKWSK